MVDECHYGRVTVKGDFARSAAVQIAAAASEGYLTTWHPEQGYGNVWRPTAAGLLFIEELDS